jgi:hypothetical protein
MMFTITEFARFTIREKHDELVFAGADIAA